MNSNGPFDDHDGHEPTKPAGPGESPTGRNFAAGMTGGVGYVHDSQGSMPINCNCETVDLEPMGSVGAQMGPVIGA
jgi:hypothetical protein